MWDFTQPQGKQVSLSEFHKLLWKIPDVWSKITRKFLSTITLARVIYCASSLSLSSHREMKRGLDIACPGGIWKPQSCEWVLEKCPPSPVEWQIILFYQNTRISVLRRKGMSLYLPCPGVKINLRFWAMGDISLSYHGI